MSDEQIPSSERTGIPRRQFLETCARAGGVLALWPGAAGLSLARMANSSLGKVGAVSSQTAKYFTPLKGGEVKCTLCPHQCVIKDKQTGKCLVRRNAGGKLQSLVYGRPAKVALQTVEQLHFFHFLPGTKALAIGTAGCALTCLYCSEAAISKQSPYRTDNEDLSPERAVVTAQEYGAQTIAFTFNEPLQCFEYVIDTAEKAEAAGIHTVVHTSAYATPEAMRELAGAVSALAIDVKAFDKRAYQRLTSGGQFDQMLAALKAAREKAHWLELTYLLVPGYNDNTSHLNSMFTWLKQNVGADIPLHFLRFFPQYRLLWARTTPVKTLQATREKAFKAGLQYVYIDNVPGDPGEATFCPACHARLLARITDPARPRIENLGLELPKGRCARCGRLLLGVWK